MLYKADRQVFHVGSTDVEGEDGNRIAFLYQAVDVYEFHTAQSDRDFLPFAFGRRLCSKGNHEV